jgi:glyoxylase-like metal-dependent hydrolase (beta-lactamase superfamily II)
MQRISDNLFVYGDTCQVYIIKNGPDGVLVDFGDGRVLDELAPLGIQRISSVLMTHHHRDQGQGLAKASAAGALVAVPFMEQDLFTSVDAHWQQRNLYHNYNSRDRLVLLESVEAGEVLRDYDLREFGGRLFEVIPTPGHTTGSISLLAEIDGRLVAFTGDLIAGAGRIWSLAATQWSFSGGEGIAATIASLLDLRDRRPQLLLPSHGEPIENVEEAIDATVARLWKILELRGHNLRLLEWRERPYEAVTPHLLRHRASLATTYVLLSQSRKALFVDFGYDFITGLAAGSDRAARRPWLYTLPALKTQFGIDKIDVVIPTHYHDDHVAGCNLLREVEGTEVWCSETFSDVLEAPDRFDLPCLWYDPIPVDRRLTVSTPVRWEEYELMLHPLPGHTLYSVALEFQVDGKRVLATGDQYEGGGGMGLNYVFPARYRLGDYTAGALLYRSIRPDIILPGHWEPLYPKPDYFDRLVERDREFEQALRDLLADGGSLGEDRAVVRLEPYLSEVAPDETAELLAEVQNPFDSQACAELHVVAPAGWRAEPEGLSLTLPPGATATVRLRVVPPAGVSVRRARVGLDLTLDGRRLGQQAEALVTVA